MTAKRMLAAVLMMGILTTGCSVVELGPEAKEEAYVLRVAQAEAPWLAAIKRFDATLAASYSTRTAFLVAIRDAGLAEGAAESLAAAVELTPPESMVADHEHWLTFRRTVAELAPELTEAATIGDIPSVLTVRQAFGEAEADFLLSIGREFCIHLAAVDPAEDCPPDQTLAGGDYGATAYEALREYAIRVGPLFLTSDDLDPGQRAQYLATVQPAIEDLLLHTGERLSGLNPPAEFVADHEALIGYFDEQYATSVAITAANAIGDDARLQELYAQFGRHLEELQQTLSEAVRPIVDPAF